MVRKDKDQQEEGFTLVEMLVSIMIFTVILVISSASIIAINESTQQTALNAEAQVQMTNLGNGIEGDIIAAKEVWVKNDHQLVLTNPDDSVVIYYPAQKGFIPSFSVKTKTRGTEFLMPSAVPVVETVNIIRHKISSTGSQSAEVVYKDYLPVDVNNPTIAWNNGGTSIENYFNMFKLSGGTLSSKSGESATEQKNHKQYAIAISLKDYNNQSTSPVTSQKIVAGKTGHKSFMMP